MHGPCGRNVNMELGCVEYSKDGTRKQSFPKAFNSVTTISNKGSFPEYCRRSPEEGDNTTKKYVRILNRSIEEDNRWVVPYSRLFF